MSTSLPVEGSIANVFLCVVCSASGSSQVNGGPTKSLETSSRELAEKECREKRKFDEVEVITGEETESNVLQVRRRMDRWRGAI